MFVRFRNRTFISNMFDSILIKYTINTMTYKNRDSLSGARESNTIHYDASLVSLRKSYHGEQLC